MAMGERRLTLDVSGFVREFERVRRGYDPAAVDHHLALIKSQVSTYLERQEHDPDESLDLVLRATKRSVDEALQDARERAEAILADARAEAERMRDEAADAAASMVREAEARVQSLDAEGRERYAEIGRLTDERRRELRRVDDELRVRAERLREVSDALTRLAGSIEPARDRPAPSVPSPVAAMADPSREIVLPAEPGTDD